MTYMNVWQKLRCRMQIVLRYFCMCCNCIMSSVILDLLSQWSPLSGWGLLSQVVYLMFCLCRNWIRWETCFIWVVPFCRNKSKYWCKPLIISRHWHKILLKRTRHDTNHSVGISTSLSGYTRIKSPTEHLESCERVI